MMLSLRRCSPRSIRSKRTLKANFEDNGASRMNHRHFGRCDGVIHAKNVQFAARIGRGITHDKEFNLHAGGAFRKTSGALEARGRISSRFSSGATDRRLTTLREQRCLWLGILASLANQTCEFYIICIIGLWVRGPGCRRIVADALAAFVSFVIGNRGARVFVAAQCIRSNRFRS